MKQTGYIPSVIENEHYVLGQGNVPFQVIAKNGDYSDSLPDGEKQALFNFDTTNCTAFGTTNQIEIYMLKAFGIKVNYSDRWLGIVSGTKPPGNDPHTVLEAIRKYGLIPEEMLPFSNDLQNVDEYFSFKGLTPQQVANCYTEGLKWLEKYDFLHEWVITPNMTPDEKINNMRISLKYSPLSLALYAWSQDENGRYIRLGNDCHWVSEYSYPSYQNILDSYDPFKKIVDQEIYFCKRISIVQKPIVETKKKINISLWQRFLNWLHTWFLIPKMV